jgi:hypothetical protein
LAQPPPELSLYYDIGREIAVWDNATDVLDRIRHAGQRWVLHNHTWLH